MNIPIVSGIMCSNERNTLRNTTAKDGEYCPRDAYGLPKGITIEKFQSYYPNIKKYSPDELFDIQFHSGTKLSNGAVLIRPITLSLGKVYIKPVKNFEGVYSVKIKQNEEDKIEHKRYMSEENLLKNRSLSRGAIKEVSPGVYEMVFLDKDGEKQNVTVSKEQCLKLLTDNFLYM